MNMSKNRELIKQEVEINKTVKIRQINKLTLSLLIN